VKILKDSSIYVLGEIFSKVIPFLLLPYLTRKLGLGGYGELANVQAYIGLAIILIGMSQEGAVARYFYFYGKRSIGLIVSAGYIYSGFISFLLLIVSYLTQNIILFYVVLTALSQTLLGVQLTLRQCQKKAFSYTLIQIINGLLTVSITVLLFEVLEATYENRILAIISANAFAFILGSYLYSKQV
jgi:O-antigen/teichoic acid export membrane protein